MSERRETERRGPERRAFREQGGRRGGGRSRRGSLGRRRRLLILLTLLALSVFALRVSSVAPRRAAEAQAAEARGTVDRILAGLRPGTLALKGAGEPSDDPPGTGPLVEAPEDVVALQEVEATLAAPLGRFPGALGVAEVLAEERLLLGQDRDARRTWEGILAQGGPEQRAEARLGLAIVALRVGLGQRGAQDRAFAFDHALWHLSHLPEGSLDGRFERAVALIELGRYDAAREAIVGLQDEAPERAEVLRAHLGRREPVPEVPAHPPPPP